MINPTLKKVARAKSMTKLNNTAGGSAIEQERDSRENPANTAKFSAYVAQRRKIMESKKNSEESKYQDDI